MNILTTEDEFYFIYFFSQLSLFIISFGKLGEGILRVFSVNFSVATTRVSEEQVNEVEAICCHNCRRCRGLLYALALMKHYYV